MNIISLFSGRELATLAWVLILLIWVLHKKETRKAILQVLKSATKKSLLAVQVLFIDYVALSVYLLWHFGFWEFSLLKDTILWTFGFAYVLLVSINNIKEYSDFTGILKNAIKWTIIIEFLVAFYSFSFAVEFFILIPVLTLLAVVQAFTDVKKEHQTVYELSKQVSAIISISIFCIIIYKTFNSLDFLLTISNLKAFILPIILTFLFFPFIYLLKLFMVYENLFGRLNVFVRDKELRRNIKMWVFKISTFNLSRVSNISKQIVKLNLYHNSNWKKDIREISRTLKS